MILHGGLEFVQIKYSFIFKQLFAQKMPDMIGEESYEFDIINIMNSYE